ncbi:MAG TPA: prepilin-type N-terminal cleavage/methylation domain-containing protein [Sedimentisphaerales bacterium]|nr:prepilin-type N-terminal cleavage/methylation domain-containing protein [Sedimentisphaerales bacterium]
MEMETMTVKRPKCQAGLTLVEIMIATVVLVIVVLGTSAFRYNAALGAREADLRMTAARIAVLLCESWQATSDPNLFEPVANLSSDLAITRIFRSGEIDAAAIGGPEDPAFILFGGYKILIDRVDYYAILSYSYISTGLRALNVTVLWPGGHQAYVGKVNSMPNRNTYKSFRLTTYVTK